MEQKPEKVILRLYPPHDLDLIHLRLQGISMSQLGYNVLFAYAYGRDIKYIPPHVDHPYKGEYRTYRTSFTIKDKKMIEVLSKVRDKKKNAFVKELIRNALVRQNLSAYLTDAALVDKEQALLDEFDGEYKRLLPHKRKKITLDELLGRKPVKVENAGKFAEVKKKKEKKAEPAVVKNPEPEPVQKATEPVQTEMAPDTSKEAPAQADLSAQQDLFNMFSGLSEDL